MRAGFGRSVVCAILTLFALAAGVPWTAFADGGRTVEVRLRDQLFVPNVIEARAGDRIQFFNDDKELHSLSLVGREELLDEEFIDPGGTHAFEVPAALDPGEYGLACTIHVEMQGKLVVRDAS